ncbi:kinase-like protein [Sistotremastrum niveocremeum HHB9708]|uniref:Kinase-like protein n=1 Tax=Sistotremastrum niveocremeum HHB9708 TaxID=1314777 RepID=A0A165A0L1_9AGAM|nr:kinase-like protein [Sistotremastrum niveocremeum HHB9708]
MSSFTNAPGAPDMEVAESFGPPGGSFDFEPLVETQPDESQPSSQELRKQKAGLWGYLHPCSPDVQKVEFSKDLTTYHFGRNPANEVVVPGIRISNFHCEIKWDGTNVVVEDKSSNGTFIGTHKIGKNQSRVLREGNEFSLGVRPTDGSPDYRWLYRHYGNEETSRRQGFWSKYDMGDRLGSGAFATVYKCMEVSTGTWYAVKDIARNRAIGVHVNEGALMREINVLTRLDHQNIVRLHEVCEEENNLYLVMELVEGGELLHYILQSGGLSEGETCRIAYQICQAMSYIHSQGICHRDLKPENILLTRDRPPNAKVADFGLAKVVEDDTFLKTMCGTPAYLAPEVVLRGPDNRYNDRVDSWSLGVIVYAMLTNSSPFIENEELPLRERIEGRKINWTPFHYHDSYSLCVHCWILSHRLACL